MRMDKRGRIRVSPFMANVLIPLVLTAMLIVGFYTSPRVRHFLSRGPTWDELVNRVRMLAGKEAAYRVPEGMSNEDLSLLLAQSLAGAYDDAAVRQIVMELKKRARLVVVATVEDFSVSSRDTYPAVEAQFYLRAAVSSVERGQYPDGTLEVYSGSYSNEIQSAVYPPDVKLKYRSGDRVRMYVDYIPSQGYVLLGGYFSIEPIFSFPFQG